MRFPWTPVSDDKHVESIRRLMVFWGRFRILLFSGNVLLACGLVYMGAEMLELLEQLAQPANAPAVPLVFVSTATVGLSFGWLFSHCVQGVISSVGGFRTERLLLKYHDRQSASISDDGPEFTGESASTEPEYVDVLRDGAG